MKPNNEKNKVLNREIKKWTASHKDVLDRLTKCIDVLKKNLDDNQKAFNDVVHTKEFNPKLAVEYIRKINEDINAINSISALKMKEK